MNPLLSFLTEIFTRLKAKSPKFFVIWQWIFGALTAITGLPTFLLMFHVSLPHLFSVYMDQSVAIASGVLLFMSKMPVDTTTVAVTRDGEVLKKTDDNKLPFTKAAEQTKGLKDGLASSITLSDVAKTTVNNFS